MSDRSAATRLVDRPVIAAHIAAGFAFFLIALFAGMFYGLQLTRLYPFPGIEVLSPGRVRMLHTNAVAYGFLFNLFIAVLYWVVPRLTAHPVLSGRLSWVIFAAWQLIVLAAAGGILGGQAQAIEWGETPTWVDHGVVVASAWRCSSPTSRRRCCAPAAARSTCRSGTSGRCWCGRRWCT
jgi:cytochrome c oxidase cbb3-type subunit 1